MTDDQLRLDVARLLERMDNFMDNFEQHRQTTFAQGFEHKESVKKLREDHEKALELQKQEIDKLKLWRSYLVGAWCALTVAGSIVVAIKGLL